MLDAVCAEALKLRRHRATWLMVWIYPVAMTLIVLWSLVYALAVAPPADQPPQSAADWLRDSTLLWGAMGSAPGRFLIAGFTALMFAGEYGWNTWKLVIPARSRWQLIAAKWIVAIGFVFLAIVVANAVLLLGEWLRSLLGRPIPQDVTLAAALEAHLAAAGKALLPIFYTVAFAGLFAVLTQSILATMILSIAIVVLEGLLPLIGVFAYLYAPGLTEALARGLPLYHLRNLLSWRGEHGTVMPLGVGAVVATSWETSFAVVAGWIAAAGAATQLWFARQDVN